MDAYAAANKAFRKCKSRSPEKNQACAGYLAKQYLIIAGVHGDELELATEHVHRLLDEWYCHKASNGSFFPQPSDEEPEATFELRPIEGVPDAESDVLS